MGCNPGKTKIEPDYSSYYKYFSKRTGQGKYILQRLSPSDLKREVYFDLIKQYKGYDSKVDDEKLKEQINDILNDDSYIILIWIYPSSQKYIVASATMNFQKSIGNKFCKLAHISHLVVDNDHRGKGLGKSLKEALTLIAFKEENVNKIIDNMELSQENKTYKIISKEEFESLYSNINFNEPKETRMLIHKTPVVSLSSYINFDEFKNGDKEFLISCSLDPDIKIYDLETNSCIKTIDSTHTKNITACLFVKRDGIFQLLTASMDQTIQLIDLSEGVLVSNFYGHKGVVNCLVQAEDIFDFNAFVSGSDDGTIKIWKYESSDPLIDIKVESQIKSMTSLKKFDENVKFAVAVGLQNGNILIYDCVAGKKINSMTHAIRSNNNEFAVTALENFFYKENNRLILSGCTNGSIKIWNSNNGNLIKSYEENKKMISSLICFTLEEKQYFVSGSIEKGDGEIILYTLEEDKSIKTLSNFGYGVNSLRYLTKYQYLVVSWNNGYRILKLNEELKG